VNFVVKLMAKQRLAALNLLPNNIEETLNSVRFCRSSALSKTLTSEVLELNVLLSWTLNCNSWPMLAGTSLALLLATLKRLASRGGRTRTSTRFPVLGRQFKRGLAPAPFFHFWCAIRLLWHRDSSESFYSPFLSVDRLNACSPDLVP
jgi:hypothetical protein